MIESKMYVLFTATALSPFDLIRTMKLHQNIADE